ncbi:MAG: cytochrome b [Chloroflexota bacterium]
MGRIFDFIDERFAVRKPHKRFLRRTVPEDLNYSYCLGGMAFTYFIVLVCTGFLLALHYVPSEREAYQSVVMITEGVPLGWLVRGLHKWSATLFIAFTMLHSIRVFASRAYRHPKELNWMAGVLAFVFAMGSGFTGYLLPWDQKAYWATEVGTSMARTVPLVGEQLMFTVRGGAGVDGATLVRFYSLHVLFLPAVTAVLLWAHFHMVKRQGISKNL